MVCSLGRNDICGVQRRGVSANPRAVRPQSVVASHLSSKEMARASFGSVRTLETRAYSLMDFFGSGILLPFFVKRSWRYHRGRLEVLAADSSRKLVARQFSPNKFWKSPHGYSATRANTEPIGAVSLRAVSRHRFLAEQRHHTCCDRVFLAPCA